MHPIQVVYYRHKFREAFYDKFANEFQDFFSKIMTAAHPGDYTSVGLQGPEGDHKADGFRRSDGTVFQCHAPKNASAKEIAKKINEDFTGALKWWGSEMKNWAFVHNHRDGPPPDAIHAINELARLNPGVKIDKIGFDELYRIFRDLDLSFCEEIFGYFSPLEELFDLADKDIKTVIDAIQSADPDTSRPIDIPKPAKINKNGLSPSSKNTIDFGLLYFTRVQEYFAQGANATLGESVAESFRNEYANLKAEDMRPDEILDRLVVFAGGLGGSQRRNSAVVAVITYFFHTCDIFENPGMREDDT